LQILLGAGPKLTPESIGCGACPVVGGAE